MAEVATFPRRGLMLILSSPSGAGKTTIARKLLAAEPGLTMSVSVTTRPMRPGEIEGRDYHFVDEAEFQRMVAAGELLEWAVVFEHHYGTPKAHIVDGLAGGQDFLFDVDWQGTQQLHQKMRDDVVPVFLLPPSLEELHRRLSARGTDSPKVIAGRMAKARSEISHWDAYDYVLINDEIEACFFEVQGILDAERLRRTRQTGLADFAVELMRSPQSP